MTSVPTVIGGYTSSVVVSLDDVSFGYGASPDILSEITLTIRSRAIVAVMGPSGSGKSTLLHLIGGLLRPRTGRIRRDQVVASETRWVFQQPSCLPRRTITENVMVGAYSRRWAKSELRRAAERAIERVGLAGMRGRQAGSLSGGELQRVQVARALVSGPALVLADEPTGQLDLVSTQAVIAAFRLARHAETSIVLATHDPDVAAECDHVFRIELGHIAGESACGG